MTRTAGWSVLLLAVGVCLVATARDRSWAQSVPAGPDALLGEYSVLVDGPAHVKFTKEGGTYFVWGREIEDEASFRSGRNVPDWKKQGEATPCGEESYAALFGPRWRDAAPIGLCEKDPGGKVALFKVKTGYRLPQSQGPKRGFLEGHTFSTGYFLFVVFGGQDAYKR